MTFIMPPESQIAIVTLFRLLAIFVIAAGLIWGRIFLGLGNPESSLQKRYWTFVIIAFTTFMPVYLGGIFFIGYVFALIFLCVREFYQIVNHKEIKQYRHVAIVISICLGISSIVKIPIHFSGFTLFLFYLMPFVIVCYAIMLWLTPAKKTIRRAITCTTIFSAIYFGWFLSHLIFIRAMPNGFGNTMFLIICVGLNDTVAFSVGKLFGKHKMSPVISPNKTWEGLFGGVLGSALAGAIFYPCVGFLNFFQILVLLLLICIMAPSGDLLMSAIKRRYNVQESGHLLPGHGGVLDRFDSLILTTPLVYYFLLVC